MTIENGKKVSLIINNRPSTSKKYTGVVVAGNFLKSLVRWNDNSGEDWIENSRLRVK